MCNPAVLIEVNASMRLLYQSALVFQLVSSMMYHEKALDMTPATSAAYRSIRFVPFLSLRDRND